MRWLDASRWNRDSFGSADLNLNHMNYSVYILYSGEFDRYYIGQTNNIESRIKRHNSGYVRSTKPYRPWNLVFQTNMKDRKAAVQLETKLKSYKSRDKIEELIKSDQNSIKK